MPLFPIDRPCRAREKFRQLHARVPRGDPRESQAWHGDYSKVRPRSSNNMDESPHPDLAGLPARILKVSLHLEDVPAGRAAANLARLVLIRVRAAVVAAAESVAHVAALEVSGDQASRRNRRPSPRTRTKHRQAGDEADELSPTLVLSHILSRPYQCSQRGRFKFHCRE